MFGEWIYKTHTTVDIPFKHILIENFLNDDIYKRIHDDFAFDSNNLNETNKLKNSWYKYENPLEVKYTNNHIDTYPESIKDLFNELSKDIIINKCREIFDINDLQYDPHFHGAGLHVMPRYGRLNIHLDYEKHPVLNKQRRLNLILYINDEWDETWNGATELWDNECIIKSYPKKNSALLFVTNDNSWHGVPEIILCPENVYRKTIAFYYLSELSASPDYEKIGNKNGYREKAVFIKKPTDTYDERLEKLYKIRPYRSITKKDMEEIYPDWTLLT